MKEVHFVLQGKGGVGKSLIATLIAQYLKENSSEPLHCYDTDPVNPTFSRYRALHPQTVNILTENNTVDSRHLRAIDVLSGRKQRIRVFTGSRRAHGIPCAAQRRTGA